MLETDGVDRMTIIIGSGARKRMDKNPRGETKTHTELTHTHKQDTIHTAHRVSSIYTNNDIWSRRTGVCWILRGIRERGYASISLLILFVISGLSKSSFAMGLFCRAD